MKNLLYTFLIFSTLANAQDRLPFKQLSSVERVFNVVEYGADTLGVADATTAIQAAINAVATAKGGTVYFPRGIYLIGGGIQTSVGGYDPNSQLYIPSDVFSNKIYHIKLMGEGMPNQSFNGQGTGATFPPSGVVLKSTYAGTRSQTVAGTAILGGSGLSQGGVGNGETSTYLDVENIIFLVKNNPNGNGPEIGGVNGRHIASTRINNCVYSVDTTGAYSTTPIENISGFETSDCDNEVNNIIENTTVFGAKYGFVVGEHTSADQIQASVCMYGVMGKIGNHGSSLNRVLVQNCKYSLGYYNNGSGCNVTTIAPLNISFLDIEWLNTGTKWFKSIYCINDSLNILKGNIRYWMSVNGTGGDGTASWVVNGATNMVTTALGASPSYIKNQNAATAYQITNTTAGTASQAAVSMTSDASANVTIGKYSSTKTAYKAIASGDGYVYNDTRGDLTFLNDYASGGFKFAAGGSSTAHLTISSTGKITFPATNTATGTTGAQTINKPSGKVNFAAAASTLVVTNSLVTTASIVRVQVEGTDATATSARVTLASGSFTITLNAAATAETKVAFEVIN